MAHTPCPLNLTLGLRAQDLCISTHQLHTFNPRACPYLHAVHAQNKLCVVQVDVVGCLHVAVNFFRSTTQKVWI